MKKFKVKLQVLRDDDYWYCIDDRIEEVDVSRDEMETRLADSLVNAFELVDSHVYVEPFNLFLLKHSYKGIKFTVTGV